MSPVAWYLGWWAPLPPAVEPDELIDPGVHGPLLAAVGAGAPLDRLGQARLDGLKAAGLARPDGRPRFPVASAEQAGELLAAAEDLGSAIARLLAGEWSRIEVEYEPLSATVAGFGEPTIAFLLVGGLVLDVGVRRLLRLQGLAAPRFGSAFAWLAEGQTRAVAGIWSARVTSVTGRGYLVRFGRPDAPRWELAAVEPEAAPALPAAREPALRALVEGIGWSIVKLVEDAAPGLDLQRRRIAGCEDEGAFLSWAYSLAVDATLGNLSARGLLAPPIDGVVSIRVADPALAGS
ncbi:MAG TPA: hypothetical protein VFA45_16805 [Actinomycetes bacterium]|jgi:hypothetical protein|nr:hypothetical protein [Actinomycetes bacterium]